MGFGCLGWGVQGTMELTNCGWWSHRAPVPRPKRAPLPDVTRGARNNSAHWVSPAVPPACRRGEGALPARRATRAPPARKKSCHLSCSQSRTMRTLRMYCINAATIRSGDVWVGCRATLTLLTVHKRTWRSTVLPVGGAPRGTPPRLTDVTAAAGGGASDRDRRPPRVLGGLLRPGRPPGWWLWLQRPRFRP